MGQTTTKILPIEMITNSPEAQRINALNNSVVEYIRYMRSVFFLQEQELDSSLEQSLVQDYKLKLDAAYNYIPYVNKALLREYINRLEHAKEIFKQHHRRYTQLLSKQ